MALFNNLFEGELHPYDLKGRWFKISFTSSPQAIISNDIRCNFGSNNYLSITDYSQQVVDYVCVFKHKAPSSTKVFSKQIRIYAGTGIQQILTPDPELYDVCDLYVYCMKL